MALMLAGEPVVSVLLAYTSVIQSQAQQLLPPGVDRTGSQVSRNMHWRRLFEVSPSGLGFTHPLLGPIFVS